MEQQPTNPSVTPNSQITNERKLKLVIRLWKILAGVLGALLILQFFWTWLSRMMPNVYGFGAVLVFVLITYTINVYNVRKRTKEVRVDNGTDSDIHKPRATLRPALLFLGWTLIVFFGGTAVFLIVDEAIHPNSTSIVAGAGIGFGFMLAVIGILLVGAFRKKRE